MKKSTSRDANHFRQLLPIDWWQLDQPQKYWLVAGAVVAIMGAIDFLDLARPYYYWGRGRLLPLGQAAVSTVQAAGWPWRVISQLNSAAHRVQQLESKLAELESQEAELTGLRAENHQLRALVEGRTSGRDGGRPTQRVTSPIVSLSQPGIGIGSNQGVQPGNMVLVSGVLVGVVTTVEPESAQLNVLSHGSAQPVVAVTEGGAEGIVVGDGRRVLLTEVLPNASVEIGQRVTTLGQPGIPRDVLIGTITADISRPEDPVATLVVDQSVGFATARLVEVVVTGPESGSARQ
ncbi:MAG: hypothetical protein COU69_01315 [Candidatus Pacebacteria bacterium CG10_big_fil_rev_8_21_14_0_10_56_10]|nr:MAG: hypothetical protein COU69_01315 [Candidatus Pacebacteria bacterium CG10_big_fil_rev_8_21_14_0_10_56_10]